MSQNRTGAPNRGQSGNYGQGSRAAKKETPRNASGNLGRQQSSDKTKGNTPTSFNNSHVGSNHRYNQKGQESDNTTRSSNRNRNYADAAGGGSRQNTPLNLPLHSNGVGPEIHPVPKASGLRMNHTKQPHHHSGNVSEDTVAIAASLNVNAMEFKPSMPVTPTLCTSLGQRSPTLHHVESPSLGNEALHINGHSTPTSVTAERTFTTYPPAHITKVEPAVLATQGSGLRTGYIQKPQNKALAIKNPTTGEVVFDPSATTAIDNSKDNVFSTPEVNTSNVSSPSLQAEIGSLDTITPGVGKTTRNYCDPKCPMPSVQFPAPIVAPSATPEEALLVQGPPSVVLNGHAALLEPARLPRPEPMIFKVPITSSARTSHDHEQQNSHYNQQILQISNLAAIAKTKYSGRRKHYTVRNAPLTEVIFADKSISVLSGPRVDSHSGSFLAMAEKSGKNYVKQLLEDEPNLFDWSRGTSANYRKISAMTATVPHLNPINVNCNSYQYPSQDQWNESLMSKSYTLSQCLGIHAFNKAIPVPPIVSVFSDRPHSAGGSNYSKRVGGGGHTGLEHRPSNASHIAINSAITRSQMAKKDQPRPNQNTRRPFVQDDDNIPEEDLGLGMGARRRSDRVSRFKGADEVGLSPASVQLRRNWMASLNKLSIEYFERIVSTLVELLQSCPTRSDLNYMVKSVFEKSVTEIQHYAELYGDLVNALVSACPMFCTEEELTAIDGAIKAYTADRDVISEPAGDDANPKEYKKETKAVWDKHKLAAKALNIADFRTLFIDRIETTIQGLSDATYEELTEAEIESCNGDPSEIASIKLLKRGRLTNTLRFFGEMYIREVISSKLFQNVMDREVIKYKFTGKSEARETESFRIVAFCQLLEQVGYKMSTETAKTSQTLNQWMGNISEKLELDSCDEYAKCKIHDLKDLKDQNWKRKAAVFKTMQPKSLQDARQDAQIEMARKNEHFANKIGYRPEEDEDDGMRIVGQESSHPYKSFYRHLLVEYDFPLNKLEKLRRIRDEEYHEEPIVNTKLVVISNDDELEVED